MLNPTAHYVCLFQTVFHAIDHHWSADMFATCGQQVDVWSEERAEPVRSFTWGVDSINSIKFNPIEVCSNWVIP